jgi:hypothetical protein
MKRNLNQPKLIFYNLIRFAIILVLSTLYVSIQNQNKLDYILYILQSTLHSLVSNLNFDIRRVYFHTILTEIAAFKLE